MTQYLRNFGLQDYADEENCLMLMRYVCEKGKVFRGYRCNYIYKNFGFAEMIVTTIDKENDQRSSSGGGGANKESKRLAQLLHRWLSASRLPKSGLT
jgi:hypothetical protein